MSIEALWWKKEGDKARCGLCFHNCLISPGGYGICGVRGFYLTEEGGFSSPTLDRFSSCAVDPIEKKPLYYWRAGSSIFSLGSVGCNMRCPFCQNHDIAHPAQKGKIPLAELPPHDLLRKVKRLNLTSVAYTYNEPTLQAEYILKAAPLLKSEGVATVLVTNGMFSPDALNELTPHIDAANIDVKTFDPRKYEAMGGSMETVKTNIAHLVKAGVHIELTNLVVPGISDSYDDFLDMVDWIADLSDEIPLHISRYFPAHTFTAPPTNIDLLKAFFAIATQKLARVHLGNMPPQPQEKRDV